MALTEEQRLRMEQKKAEALAKMKSRQSMLSNAKPSPQPMLSNAKPSPQTFHNISSPAAKAPFVPPRSQDVSNQRQPQKITNPQFVPPKPAANPQFPPVSGLNLKNQQHSAVLTGANKSTPHPANTSFVSHQQPSSLSKPTSTSSPCFPTFTNQQQSLPVSSFANKLSVNPSNSSFPNPSNPISGNKPTVIPSNSSFPNPSNPISGNKPFSVSSSGLTEDQKRLMESKRQAALAKKQSQSQISNVTNNPYKSATPSSTLNAQSFYKPAENPPKLLLPNQNKYLSNVSQNKLPGNNNNLLSNRVKGTLSLITKDRFEVQVNYHETLIKIFKTLKTSSYNAKTRIWNFHLLDHDALIQATAPLRPDLDLTPLPRWILETFKKPKPEQEVDITSIEPLIYESLMPFQHEGIKYGISRNGRVLIADDMGLGKTVQALGLASYYKESWPFLIVSPSSMRFPWKTAIERWLPSVHIQQIQIILTGKDVVGNQLVTIISYDLLTKKLTELQKKNYQLIIMDESHCLKNEKSARTKAAEPLMKSCRNLILLSGTPALSRPMELYSQISALQPRLFKYVSEYGMRYCDGKMKTIGTKEIPDFSGSSHMQELSLLLSQRCMIRRLKTEVLNQLPEKRREMVLLDPASVNCTSKIMKDKEKAAKKTNLGAMEKRGLLLEWYAATSQAKLSAVQQYVKDLAQSEKKFLCFCHHRVMIAGIAEMLENEKIDFMLIDGGVTSEARKKAVDRFQTVDTCRVALLSITAANSGITLTAAQLVVFAEIYWNPGILCQAEDRTHRIGQTNSVLVQYLVATGTADDELWPMIKRKLDVLNQAGLSKDNFENSDSRQLESKDQSRIRDYFKAESGDLEDDDEFEKLWGSMEDLEETEFEQDLPAKKMRLI